MKNCKFCNAEMEDEQTVCPACGKDVTEEAAEKVAETTEAPVTEETVQATPTEEKVSPARRAGAWVLLGLFALVLAFTALIFFSAPKNVEPSTADRVMIQDTERNFTAENADLAQDVVATCEKAAMGNKLVDGLHALGIGNKKTELTNATLALFYWDNFYSFYNQNGYYLSLMGMDPAAMEASKTESGQTWQEYFLSIALDHFRQQTAVCAKAKAEGFVLPAEYSEELADMREQLSGMENIDQELQHYYGAGITLEDYLDYIENGYYYSAYLEQCRGKIAVSNEELDAFYAEHQDEYEQSGLKAIDKNVISVRHILVRPEDAADEASWTAAQTKANDIYREWQEGEKTEDSFAALAQEYSEDNAANGGLYEDVYPGQMVTSFNDWCFADDRKVGDSGIVQTEYGFHIMYFVGEGDVVYWREVVRQDAALEKLYDEVDEIKMQYSLSYDLDKIAIPMPTQIAEDTATQNAEVPEQVAEPQTAETETETAEQNGELQPEESIETVSQEELAEMFGAEAEQPAA